MEVPSGDQATALTILVWPEYVTFQLPVIASHIRTTFSSVPSARDLPSGDQATERTIPVSRSAYFNFPVVTPNTCPPLLPPTAIEVPSGDQPTALIIPGCLLPIQLGLIMPVAASQTYIKLSSHPEVKVLPSSDQAAVRTA